MKKTVVKTLLVLLVLGLLGAMVMIPAFSKFREQSREKAILSNLHQIIAAGQQYILEEQVTQVSYRQLVGDYFHELQPVLDESYDDITIYEAGGTAYVDTKIGSVEHYY